MKDAIKKRLTGKSSTEDAKSAGEQILDLLKNNENHAWRIVYLSDLGQYRLFRNFCIFHKQKNGAIAYFTYLDRKHCTLFTKGAWAQYKTQNKEYIGYLENDFGKLWNMATDIKDWLQARGVL